MLSRGWGNTPLPNLDCAQTDVDGLCRVSGNTDKGESYFGTEKRHGYYDSRQGRLHFSEHSILKFGRWLPDDLTVTVRLDRVVRPIPLFAKRVGGGRLYGAAQATGAVVPVPLLVQGCRDDEPGRFLQ